MASLPDGTQDREPTTTDPTRVLTLFRELRDTVEAIAAYGAAGYSHENAVLYMRSLHEYWRLLRETPIFSEANKYGSPFPFLLTEVLIGRRKHDGKYNPPWSDSDWRIFRAGVKVTEERISAAIAASGIETESAGSETLTSCGESTLNRAQLRSRDRKQKALALQDQGLTQKEIARELRLNIRTVQLYLAERNT